MMKKAKEYLNERTAEIDAESKKQAVKAWFVEFFEGLETFENTDGDNFWLVIDDDYDYGVQFDITLGLNRIKVDTDHRRNGEWQGVIVHHYSYCNNSASELAAHLTTLFCNIIPDLTR